MKNSFFRYFILFGIFLLPFISYSQELKWIYKIGGITTDYCAGVTLDNNQNVYDITNFTGNVSIALNVTKSTRGQEDILIRKSSPAGIQQWIRQVGSKSQDIAQDIVVDNQNNVYIVGTFRDSLFMDSTHVLTTLANSYASFIIKLNSEGNFQWAQKIVSDLPVVAKTVSTGPIEDIVVSGHFDGVASFPDNRNLTSNGGNDVFILKINRNTGATMYLKQIGGIDQDFGIHHAVDNENNIYITGDFRASVDFDPNNGELILNSKGLTDIFLLKLSESGNFLWAKAYGGINVDYGHSIAIDKDKNIILTGRFSETVGFGSTTQALQSKGSTDIFLLKLNRDGITQWVNGYGDVNNDVPGHVMVNSNGIIYLAGTFRNKVDFDPSPVANFSDSNGGADGFLALYNQDGSYNDRFSFGGISNEQIHKIALKANGEVIVGGGFGAIVDFDPRQLSELNIFSSGGLDAFMINVFVCVNPYIKELRVVKPNLCYGENVFIQIVEGHLNSATQWSWQREKCDNLTFAAGPFLNIPVLNNTSFFVKGWGGCVVNDQCRKIDIQVFKDTLQYQFFELCEGDTIKVGNNRYTSAGVFTDSLKSISGCDSVLITEIVLNKSYKFNDNYQICPGDTVKVGGSRYTFSGVYTNVFKTKKGCDSIIISNISVKPTNIETINQTICEGTSITIGNVVYNSSGTFIQESANPNGCKDLKIVNIKIAKRDVVLQKNICFGDSLRIGNKLYTVSGTFKDTLISSLGCDSVITTMLEVKSLSSSTQFYQICEGDSVIVGSKIYKTSGNYIDVFKNVAGCDSTVFSGVVVVPKVIPTLKMYTICEGDSVKVSSKVYKVQGLYQDTLRSTKGCDSIITTNLKVFLRNNIISVSICDGDTLIAGSSRLTASGSYTIPFKNYFGCDSIVTIVLTVKQQVNKTFDYFICPGDSALVKGVYYKTPQTLAFKYPAQNGCDSIETHQVKYKHVTTTQNITICNGNVFVLNGKTYKEKGIYTETFKKSDGCDSILQLVVNVNPSYIIDTLFERCKGESVTVGTSTYLNPGKFVENLKTTKGCDSTIRFELRITNFIPAVFLARDTLSAFVIDGAKYQWYECSNNNTRIPFLGATSSAFPLFRSGKYSLGITFRNCTYFSDCLDYIRTSTEELPANIVTIYPNPFSDIVQISAEKDLKLKIADIQGRIKGEYEIMNGKNEINVNQFESGIYIFELSDSNGKLFVKTLKL